MSAEPIFVSYSSRDRKFAMAFTQTLQDLGATVWIDQMGIGLGKNWDNEIEEALENSNTLLLFISKTSAASENVQDEVSIAKNTKMQIVPILIEECDLPMRWQRLQYADFLAAPDKAMTRVLDVLGIDTSEASRFVALKSKLFRAKDSKAEVEEPIEDETADVGANADLLISEAEIDKATQMHKKAIKKNKQLIGFVAGGSIALLLILQFIVKVPQENMLYTIIGCLLLMLLAVKPWGNINKSAKNIELIDLLKIKRERLTRIMNKLSDDEIQDFNNEFHSYIAI